MAIAATWDQLPMPVAAPATNRPIRAGRKRISSRTGWTSIIRRSSRCHSASAAVQALAHVASPGTASARRVSWSTSSRASCLSSPTIASAPAAEAVVTVTEARPNSRANAPSS